jgi:hypothetical protein
MPSRYVAVCQATPVSVSPSFFRLERADGVAIDEQQVVRAPVSGCQHELAHCDTTRGRD